MATDVNVLIVGGGLTGTSIAYFLTQHGIEPIVIEAGKIGQGSNEFLSGTAGPQRPAHSKMVVAAHYAAFEYGKAHGHDKGKMLLDISISGRDIMKTIAKSLAPDLVREYGSLVVGNAEEFQELQEMVKFYRIAERAIDWHYVSRDEIITIYKNKPEAFAGGVTIPSNFIANSRLYVNLLRKRGEAAGAHFVENTKVLNLEDLVDSVEVKTNNPKEEKINAAKVVIATNGFVEDPNLSRMVRPYASFVICYENKGPNTPITWNFSDYYRYWTRQDDTLMIGGEDVPVEKVGNRFIINETAPIRKLQEWANEVFPETQGLIPSIHFGVEALTDGVPIVGLLPGKNNIYVVVGCNGIGHSLLTYGASSIPALMGYAEMTDEQRKFANFLSPNRTTLRS